MGDEGVMDIDDSFGFNVIAVQHDLFGTPLSFKWVANEDDLDDPKHSEFLVYKHRDEPCYIVTEHGIWSWVIGTSQDSPQPSPDAILVGSGKDFGWWWIKVDEII
jgi:hypothetical protein